MHVYTHTTCMRVYIYWGTKVWNIDINFVVFKKQMKK